MTIRCEIVSQDRLVFEGDVDIVVLPGTAGKMGILPNHAPLLSTLKMGVVEVRVKDQAEVFTVTGGLVEVQPDIVTVLADAAENIEEIDAARAEEAKKRAEARMEEGVPDGDLNALLAVEAALRRSSLRLDAVRRYKTGRARISDYTDSSKLGE